ncbi:hypothetical protein AVEN_4652-1 [Araneus ventricosus]|uniref:RNase H type-1 domain-containing protein n=1 Tax=Araneus ventricosus TaxID=182803 RepID=A0A4Y2VE76_ARAVE|nr:hypothetical protein AVEN_4652-1 [Araneus ventricosus]
MRFAATVPEFSLPSITSANCDPNFLVSVTCTHVCIFTRKKNIGYEVERLHPQIDDDYDLDTWEPKEIIEVLWDNGTPYPANILQFGENKKLMDLLIDDLIIGIVKANQVPLTEDLCKRGKRNEKSSLKLIRLGCVKAHIGIKGNEISDNLAKEATTDGLPASLPFPNIYLKTNDYSSPSPFGKLSGKMVRLADRFTAFFRKYQTNSYTILENASNLPLAMAPSPPTSRDSVFIL